MPSNKIPLTDEIFDKICEDIAESGMSLRSILEKHNTSVGVFFRFKEKKTHREEQYTRAYNLQYHLMGDDIIDEAKNKKDDTLDGEFGKIGNAAAVNRSRVIVDSYKWILSKKLPKEYGDKIQVDSDVKTTQIFKIGDKEIFM